MAKKTREQVVDVTARLTLQLPQDANLDDIVEILQEDLYLFVRETPRCDASTVELLDFSLPEEQEDGVDPED